MLDNKLYALSGTIPGFYREHLVVYSHFEECCFVAIRDNLTGSVVTLLPLEFHKKLAWEIPESECALAKELYLGAPKWAPKAKREPKINTPKAFVIKAHFTGKKGGKNCVVILKIKGHVKVPDIQTLIDNDWSLYKKIAEAIAKSNIQQELLYAISIRRGQDGELRVIDLS